MFHQRLHSHTETQLLWYYNVSQFGGVFFSVFSWRFDKWTFIHVDRILSCKLAFFKALNYLLHDVLIARRHVISRDAAQCMIGNAIFSLFVKPNEHDVNFYITFFYPLETDVLQVSACLSCPMCDCHDLAPPRTLWTRSPGPIDTKTNSYDERLQPWRHLGHLSIEPKICFGAKVDKKLCHSSMGCDCSRI